MVRYFKYEQTKKSIILEYPAKDFEPIKNLYDDFTVKQNLYSPGFHIPVHASSRIYKDKPDYIVILAWRYKDQIIKKHKRFLDNGGCFIVPLPEYKIIKS